MDLGSILIVFVIVLISMILHEMAHAYVAYFLGDTTAKDEGRLTPNPLVHIDPWMSIVVPLLLFISGGPVFGGAKPVPIDRRNLKGGAWGMALVAVAGPLMNLILAFGAFLIAHFTGVAGPKRGIKNEPGKLHKQQKNTLTVHRIRGQFRFNALKR